MIKIRTAYSVMNEIYERISQNTPFDKKLKPYSKKKVESVKFFFEEREEYEKCHIINKFIKERFDHNINFLK